MPTGTFESGSTGDMNIQHSEAVSRIKERVETFSRQYKRFRVYHGSTGSTRHLDLQPDCIVDISDMRRLFPVNIQDQTVRVEPNVPIDALVAHTWKVGLIPKIAMEFKGLTTGGSFSCLSGASSSFKYDTFEQTVSEIETILGNGEVRHASKKQDTELLRAAAGSLGTFGIVTLLTMELIEAKPFVNLELIPVADIPGVMSIMENVMEHQGIDFVDGISFTQMRSVVTVGRLTYRHDLTSRFYSRKQLHGFTDLVETTIRSMATKSSVTITMPTCDYFFRCDHGAFWRSKLAFQKFRIPDNRVTRFLTDPILDSRTAYRALAETGVANQYIVQDFVVPSSLVNDFVLFVRDLVGGNDSQFYILPGLPISELGLDFKLETDHFNPNTVVGQQRVIGVGVYCQGPKSPLDFLDMNRSQERKAHDLRGIKTLYSRTYYSEEEFWKVVDKPRYDALREKYDATRTIPNMYEKLAADMERTKKRDEEEFTRGLAGTVRVLWGFFKTMILTVLVMLKGRLVF